MKNRLLLFALTLLLAGCATTQPATDGTACDCQRTARVPDKVFRQFLLDEGLAQKARGMRLKATPKGCAQTVLECYDRGIGSLQGIELFPQLEEVVCSDNPLRNLDLNALPRLQRLYGLNVPLEHVAIDSCHGLRRLQLSHTRLQHFDLKPFPELELLLLIFSPIDTLDLAPCQQLHTLYVRGTQIEELDLHANPNIIEIHALDTPLRRLIVSREQYESNRLRASVPDSVRIVVR